MSIRRNHVLIKQPGHLQGHILIIGGLKHVEPLFLPLREVTRPGQQGSPVFLQRVAFPSTTPGGFSLKPLPTAGRACRRPGARRGRDL